MCSLEDVVLVEARHNDSISGTQSDSHGNHSILIGSAVQSIQKNYNTRGAVLLYKMMYRIFEHNAQILQRFMSNELQHSQLGCIHKLQQLCSYSLLGSIQSLPQVVSATAYVPTRSAA